MASKGKAATERRETPGWLRPPPCGSAFTGCCNPAGAKQSRNDQTPPQTYICSTPTARPGKQQAALLWLLQLSKQTLWAVVLV